MLAQQNTRHTLRVRRADARISSSTTRYRFGGTFLARGRQMQALEGRLEGATVR
jgi:hypothetical protein